MKRRKVPVRKNINAMEVGLSSVVKSAFHSYRLFWINYFDFHTRATRADFWWPIAFNNIIANAFSMSKITAVLWFAAVIVPFISLMARRYHDIGLSGWFQVAILPNFIVGFIPTRKTGNKYAVDTYQSVFRRSSNKKD